MKKTEIRLRELGWTDFGDGDWSNEDGRFVSYENGRIDFGLFEDADKYMGSLTVEEFDLFYKLIKNNYFKKQ